MGGKGRLCRWVSGPGVCSAHAPPGAWPGAGPAQRTAEGPPPRPVADTDRQGGGGACLVPSEGALPSPGLVHPTGIVSHSPGVPGSWVLGPGVLSPGGPVESVLLAERRGAAGCLLQRLRCVGEALSLDLQLLEAPTALGSAASPELCSRPRALPRRGRAPPHSAACLGCGHWDAASSGAAAAVLPASLPSSLPRPLPAALTTALGPPSASRSDLCTRPSAAWDLPPGLLLLLRADTRTRLPGQAHAA